MSLVSNTTKLLIEWTDHGCVRTKKQCPLQMFPPQYNTGELVKQVCVLELLLTDESLEKGMEALFYELLKLFKEQTSITL